MSKMLKKKKITRITTAIEMDPIISQFTPMNF